MSSSPTEVVYEKQTCKCRDRDKPTAPVSKQNLKWFELQVCLINGIFILPTV